MRRDIKYKVSWYARTHANRVLRFESRVMFCAKLAAQVSIEVAELDEKGKRTYYRGM